MISSIDSKSGEIRKSSFDLRNFLINQGILFILIILCIAISLMTKSFYNVGNIINVLRQVSVNGIIACGMTMIIITGGIDLSAGSVLALCGVVVASFAQVGHSAVFAIFMSLLVGALCGLINGIFVSYTKIPAFIATLGMQQAAKGAALLYSGGRPIADLSDDFRVIGTGTLGPIPYPVFICIIIMIITFILLKKTKLGKHTYAIGGNEVAATVCGIRVARVKMMLFIYMGIMTGLAAAVLTARVSAGNPAAGLNYEFDAITAVVIGGASLNGGVGSIYGTVVGVFIIGVLNNGLSLMQISPYWQMIIKGALIVAAVLLDTLKGKFQK